MARSLTDGTGWRDSNDRSPPLRGGGGHQVSSPMAEYQSRLSSAPTTTSYYRQRRRQKTQTHTHTHNAQTSETLLRDTHG